MQVFTNKQIVVFGAGGSGKSMLMKRASIVLDADDPGDWATRFHDHTIGVEFASRVVGPTKFQMCEIAPGERFRYYNRAIHTKTSNIITFVCDASNLESFEITKSMFDEVLECASPELFVLLVNKMEVAVEGANEAAAALEEHMRQTIDASNRPFEVPVVRTKVSVTDPPTAVMWKLGGGASVLKHLVWVPKNPGSVRIPAIGQVDNIRRVSRGKTKKFAL